jgi:hypothetical protein
MVKNIEVERKKKFGIKKVTTNGGTHLYNKD